MPPGHIDSRVIRIRRPETIADLRIAALVGRAILAVDFPGVGPQDLYAEWAGQVHLDTFGFFLGFEPGPGSPSYVHDAPRALAVVTLPTSHAMIAPQCLAAYNEGKPELARRVGAKMRAWLMENGFNIILGMHQGRVSDKAYIRAFRHFGRGRRFASVIAFEV